MGFASYSDHRPQQQKPNYQVPSSVNVSRTLSKCFGYMAIGLAITAVTAFLVGLAFAKWIFAGYVFSGDQTQVNQTAFNTYIAIMVVSFIALLIDSIAMSVVMAKGKHSIWIPYIIYALLMGVFLSTFIVVGVDFALIGEAAGISALVFLALFLIGYLSKKDLNIAAFIGFAFLMVLAFLGIFFLLLYLIAPQSLVIYNVIFMVAFSVVLLIVVAADAYNIKKIIQKGEMTNNLALYCAFTMYSDFIIIFIRVLYFLMLLKGNKR